VGTSCYSGYSQKMLQITLVWPATRQAKIAPSSDSKLVVSSVVNYILLGIDLATAAFLGVPHVDLCLALE